MISLSYACPCGVSLLSLDDAQAHADTTSHDVMVKGAVTSRRPKPLTQLELDRRALKELEREADRLRQEIKS